MHAKDLTKNFIGSNLYLIDGDDAYWISFAERFFAGLADSLSVKTLSKLENISDIEVAVFSMGLFDDSQIVLVKDSEYKLKGNDRKRLDELFSEDLGSNLVVFSQVGFLTPQDKKKLTVIDCKKLDKSSVSAIVKARFGQNIEPRASDLLCEYTNMDMMRINGEIEKLSCYADGSKITAKMVEEIVVEDTELQIYQFVNAITAGKNDLALRLLNRLKKRGESSALLLASLIKQYRRMLHSALSPLSDGELAKLFGVKEYAVTKTRERRINKMKTKKSLDTLVSYEYKFKSGELSEQRAFDMAVASLMEV